MSSVIQGSVMGGVLFIIYINDIDDAIPDSLLWKFADDTKVAQLIQNQEDGERFQQVIDALWEWADRREMSFNVAKCKILHFGKKNLRREYFME